jgi:predicted Zn-dependent protease
LKRLQGKEGRGMPSWMSTHPDPGEREQTILELAEKYQAPGALQALGQDDLHRAIEGMVVGEDPRQGFVEGNTFYHPEMAFQFPVPSGWEVKNEPAGVMMKPGREPAIMMLTLAPGKDARRAAQEFAQKEGIQVVRSEATTVNGFPAVSVVGQARTQQGTIGLLNYFISSGDRVFHFVGMAPAQQFSAMQNRFVQTMSGFAPLRDERYLKVQPSRLAIVTAEREGTFSSFLPTSRVAGLKPEELAIMNQVELNTRIPAGTKLKVPTSVLRR